METVRTASHQTVNISEEVDLTGESHMEILETGLWLSKLSLCWPSQYLLGGPGQVLADPLAIQFLAMCLGKQQRIGQILRHLLATRKTEMKFPGPDFSSAQPMPVQPSGE